MKLLILTQKIDRQDSVLGFMHGWVEAFAAKCEKVTVIALSVGDHALPPNVTVLSLGKELGRSRVRALMRFFSYIWQYRAQYDTVFVHMNQVYVLLGGLVWRVLGKHITLWYAHGHVPLSLYPAVWLSHRVFTSTQSGMRIATKKKTVVGQGIDTDLFVPGAGTAERDFFHIVTVGRLSPSKDYETLIAAADELLRAGRHFRISIVGGPVALHDGAYREQLIRDVESRGLAGHIFFVGPVANAELLGHLQGADLFVNMGRTGSLDKAIPEAMAAGLPILSCNEAVLELLGPELSQKLVYPKGDSDALFKKISSMMGMQKEERVALGRTLREIVVARHSLRGFTDRICSYFPQ